MTDLLFMCLGAAIVGAIIFYAGHKTATNALLAKAGAGLTTIEQEIVAAYRKATGKVPAAAPAANPPTGAPPSP